MITILLLSFVAGIALTAVVTYVSVCYDHYKMFGGGWTWKPWQSIICAHCGLERTEHVHKKKCPFAPTSFKARKQHRRTISSGPRFYNVRLIVMEEVCAQIGHGAPVKRFSCTTCSRCHKVIRDEDRIR